MSQSLTIPASHPLFAILYALASLPTLPHERATKDGKHNVYVTGKLDLPDGLRFYGSLYVPVGEAAPAPAPQAPAVRKGKAQASAPVGATTAPAESASAPAWNVCQTHGTPFRAGEACPACQPPKVAPVSADGGTAQPGKVRKPRAAKAPAATQPPAVAERPASLALSAPESAPATVDAGALMARLMGTLDRMDARLNALETGKAA